MRFRVLSDLHLEFSDGWFDVDHNDLDKDTVLVLAGDIGVASKPSTYVDFIKSMCSRFKRVIWVMGNHEHYQGSLLRTASKISNKMTDSCDNLTVIDHFDAVEFDDCVFVCGTLWSDLNNREPLLMYTIDKQLNDYRAIRTGDDANPYKRNIRADDTVELFDRTRDYIFDRVAHYKQLDKHVVVVTHHGPSRQSIAPQYTGSNLNGAFVSDLDDLILQHQPDMWIHGHTHSSFDYNIDQTRVIVNPRGYHRYEHNEQFVNDLSFEVQ